MESVEKAVRHEVIKDNGKEYPVVITTIVGNNVYDTPDGPVTADEYQEIDWGPKLGATRTYGHGKAAVTEEAAAHRKSIERLVGRLRRE